MNIIEIIKEIIKSKSILLTIVISSGLIIFGKYIKFNLVSTIPQNFMATIYIIFIISSIYLLILFFTYIYKIISGLMLKIYYKIKYTIFRMIPLDNVEKIIINELSKAPNEFLHLDTLSSKYKNKHNKEKLIFLVAAKKLETKGLIISYYFDDSYQLTDLGTEIALKI